MHKRMKRLSAWWLAVAVPAFLYTVILVAYVWRQADMHQEMGL